MGNFKTMRPKIEKLPSSSTCISLIHFVKHKGNATSHLSVQGVVLSKYLEEA